MTGIPPHRRKTNWYSGTPGRLLLRGSLDWEVATDLRAFAVSTLDSARGSVGTLVPRHGSAPYSPSFAARHRGFVLGCLSPGGHPTSPRQRLKGAYRQCDLRRPPDSSLARAHPMHRVVRRERSFSSWSLSLTLISVNECTRRYLQDCYPCRPSSHPHLSFRCLHRVFSLYTN